MLGGHILGEVYTSFLTANNESVRGKLIKKECQSNCGVVLQIKEVCTTYLNHDWLYRNLVVYCNTYTLYYILKCSYHIHI